MDIRMYSRIKWTAFQIVENGLPAQNKIFCDMTVSTGILEHFPVRIMIKHGKGFLCKVSIIFKVEDVESKDEICVEKLHNEIDGYVWSLG